LLKKVFLVQGLSNSVMFISQREEILNKSKLSTNKKFPTYTKIFILCHVPLFIMEMDEKIGCRAKC
jgi:hypothetical protein